MIHELSLIAVDIGNTSVKIGVFKKGNLTNVSRIAFSELKQWRDDHPSLAQFPVVVSSVVNEAQHEVLTSTYEDVHFINQQNPLPYSNHYATPSTVGMDRLCNVAAVIGMFPKQPKLIIDLGTCVKFDFVDQNNYYHGGSISPGLRLRFKSLHRDTGRLPLINPINESIPLIGNSTTQSILSGVQNGLQLEINGMIESYQRRYPNLTIFMTGGDLCFFDFELKNSIFVDENITLKGIYAIYSFHAH